MPNRFFMESVAPTQWCVFILGIETSRSAPEHRVRQIEFAEARNLARKVHLRDVVDVEIGEDLFEFRHDVEVAGGVGEVERVAAMPGPFGDAHAGGAHGAEGFVGGVHQQRMRVDALPGSNSTRLGLRTTLRPRTSNRCSASMRRTVS